MAFLDCALVVAYLHLERLKCCLQLVADVQSEVHQSIVYSSTRHFDMLVGARLHVAQQERLGVRGVLEIRQVACPVWARLHVAQEERVRLGQVLGLGQVACPVWARLHVAQQERVRLQILGFVQAMVHVVGHKELFFLLVLLTANCWRNQKMLPMRIRALGAWKHVHHQTPSLQTPSRQTPSRRTPSRRTPVHSLHTRTAWFRASLSCPSREKTASLRIVRPAQSRQMKTNLQADRSTCLLMNATIKLSLHLFATSQNDSLSLIQYLPSPNYGY